VLSQAELALQWCMTPWQWTKFPSVGPECFLPWVRPLNAPREEGAASPWPLEGHLNHQPGTHTDATARLSYYLLSGSGLITVCHAVQSPNQVLGVALQYRRF